MQPVKHPGGVTDAICIPCSLRIVAADRTGPAEGI